MEVYLLLLLLVSLVFYKYLRGSRTSWYINKLPGPNIVPILGNLLSLMDTTKLIKMVATAWPREYGSIYRIWLGPTIPVVIISSPDYVEVILNSKKHIKKSKLYDVLIPWLGRGIFIGTGQKWQSLRKAIKPTLTSHSDDTFMNVYNKYSQQLVSSLRKKAETKEIFDINEDLTLCALNIIFDSSIGINIGKKEYKNYITSMRRLIAISVQRAISCFGQLDWMFYLSPTGKEYKNVLGIINAVSKYAIKQRKEQRLQTNKVIEEEDVLVQTKTAFLDRMLELIETNKLNLSDEDLNCEVNNLIFAGHDTTSGSLSWTIYILGRYTKIQEEAYQEVIEILGPDTNRPITTEDTDKMNLLDRIMKESLRLYPVAPFILRELEEDVVLGIHQLPKGIQIAVNIFGLHRNPQVFPNPHIFDPDRFLPESTAKRGPFDYIPFSAGPRNCIGQKFALQEEKVILATLLRNFIFESVEREEDLTLVYELFLMPKTGMKVKITARNQNEVT